MKLKEMTEAIATACELKPRQVLAVQRETFRMIAEAADKGERVTIPDFGTFSTREMPQEGAEPKKIVRFRRKSADESGAESKGGDAGSDAQKQRRAKRKKAAPQAADAAADDTGAGDA
ncbi:MAG: HU family DNA-binding protein [Alphaproteobacteria bacterium]|nr:HU family DNA-binding protein [Alphaproteobacteria bacterium]